MIKRGEIKASSHILIMRIEMLLKPWALFGLKDLMNFAFTKNNFV